ncbi:SIR2 family protein [Gelidibacter gilvus]|uniref:SIR2-like domain-containing protein n=1 Tax=Gelidibacter gilvus TaxID=59602 RepID=A0A4Q0XFU1_9FLAO|nr:SIR2 family protein [Gelidibacter gilvus]RXJ45579.1 hypothetical protein ESZ48_15300 [Gelidibacter gilvus]
MNIDKIETEFKKVIESSHFNFLIGSGASRPFLDTLNDLEINITIINESNEGKIIENRDLLKASVFLEYLNKCLFGNLFFNDEDNCNYIKSCAEAEDGKADEFKNVKKSYNDFVFNINELLNKRDIQLLSKQVNIFTTNVDVFLEESLEFNKCSFNDGFGGRKQLVFDTVNFHNTTHKLSTHYEYKSEVPLINLFKIHGSLNWIKSTIKSDSEYNITADYFIKKLTELYELTQTNIADFINYKTLSNSINKNDFSFLESHKSKKETIKRFLELYDQIVMINPTKQKFEDTTRNLHYYEMLRIYANHLERENSVLFVLGFSFADEHIQKITQRVASSNPTLIIYILCSSAQKEEFGKKFKGFNNVKYLHPEEGYFTIEKLNAYFSNILSSIPSNK